MGSPRVLVAGIGNIFLGDDGWGVEVVNRLAQHPMPDGVRVADFGIRGVHLAYELLDGYDTAVLVDAVQLGDEPGAIAVLEPDVSTAPTADAGAGAAAELVDPHGMNPEVVLRMVEGLGGYVRRTLIVGCQPANLDEGIGLSPTVAEAVEPTVAVCRQLVDEIVHPNLKERLR